MEGNLWFIIKLLPYLAFCCLISGFVGWSLRGRVPSPPPTTIEKSRGKTSSKKSRR